MVIPSTHVGPPKLIDFSCRIREPDSGSAACLLTFELEDKEGVSTNQEGNTSIVNMEMQPSTLTTLLEGLTRIRDQLSSVANKKQ
ncbi:COMM domain-containing protein 9 [Frankliniella occidentalis]|uniref:COMM domain-containing protein 9 n=1 Tax=Frankliniella occidentalis TaxID=133901 RepID=A0A6J1STN3_FRAOC|nr:COMM domain-containing protein 9 [Frankliniella occidentalis]